MQLNQHSQTKVLVFLGVKSKMNPEEVARSFADWCVFADTLHYAEIQHKKHNKSQDDILKELETANISDQKIKDLMRKAIISHFELGNTSPIFTNTFYQI
jgi:hypothetical protein